MCSIALFSKFIANNVGAGELVEVRHNTLKFMKFNLFNVYSEFEKEF